MPSTLCMHIRVRPAKEQTAAHYIHYSKFSRNSYTGEQVREAADKDHEEGGAVVKLEGSALDDDGPQVAMVTSHES